MNNQSNSVSSNSSEFSFSGFLLRLAFALVLVLVTYNPSGLSVFHWVRDSMAADGLRPVHFFTGALLAIGWTILVAATLRALGGLGMVLLAAAIGTFIWMLTDFGVLGADSATAIAWISLICLSLLLAVGLSWSHIWRRLTGQFNVDEVDR